MHVPVAHCVRDTIDAFAKELGASSQQSPHVVHFFPVPLSVIVFPELPHGVATGSKAPDHAGALSDRSNSRRGVRHMRATGIRKVTINDLSDRLRAILA